MREEVVIYYSEEDSGWIAHGLRTDQIGTGDRIVDALADLMKAVHQICAEAAKDKTLAYLRAAPQEIQDIARRAIPLPGEIYEIAYKKVHGQWPEDWVVTPETGDQPFKAELREAVPS